MTTISRVVGSGFTTLNFMGKPISLLDAFTDSGQSPISGPEPVYSIGNGYADEIATSRVLAPGQLTVQIREVWHAPVWQYLLGLAGVNTSRINGITQAYAALDRLPGQLTAQMVIKNPNAGGGFRGKIYHGLTITDMAEGESVNVGALTVPRTITFMYVKATYFTGDPARARR